MDEAAFGEHVCSFEKIREVDMYGDAGRMYACRSMVLLSGWND